MGRCVSLCATGIWLEILTKVLFSNHCLVRCAPAERARCKDPAGTLSLRFEPLSFVHGSKNAMTLSFSEQDLGRNMGNCRIICSSVSCLCLYGFPRFEHACHEEVLQHPHVIPPPVPLTAPFRTQKDQQTQTPNP